MSWARTSFSHASLSAHGDVKLWTLTPVSQQLLIHCRLAVLCFWLTLVKFAFCWSWQWHNCTMKYILTVICTADLGTFYCFEMAPSDFPDFFHSMSSLDFPIVVIVSESIINSSLNQTSHMFFCDKEVCVVLILSQKIKSCTNPWNSRLPKWYKCSLHVQVNLWPQMYILHIVVVLVK